MVNLGFLVVLIVLLGYASNWLNWRYLNYRIVRFLFYIGVIVHELSHAVFCCLTGAVIKGGSIFSKEPHITHSKPKLPYLGQILISLAPIIGGLLFLFFVNKYYLADYFKMPLFYVWQDFLTAPFLLLAQINLFDWQCWILILIFLNIGAMIGPSWQDLKNIWVVIIIFFFFKCNLLVNLAALAVILILADILIKIILILIIKIIKIIFAAIKQ